MISPGTTVLNDLAVFFFGFVPIGVLLWAITRMFEGIRLGQADRNVRKRLLRWQKFFFRGRYLIGGPDYAKASEKTQIFVVMRGFILFMWAVIASSILIKVFRHL